MNTAPQAAAKTPPLAPTIPTKQLLRRVGTYTYDYDTDGRLKMVADANTMRECYIYNKKGQRVRDKAAPTARERLFRYDVRERLVQAGTIKIAYDENGKMVSRVQLVSREFETQGLFPQNTRGGLHTFYGDDTRLDRAITPYGTDVRYRYEQGGIMPVAICEADADTDMFRYTWDGLRLKSFYNGLEDTRYVFDYQNAADRLPITASVYIGKRIGIQSKPVQIALEYTHTGSLLNVFRCLPDGKKLCIKNVEYTAFGIPIKDSAPNFYFPLGFAGGLFDPYTGFVRFGLRDYDPMLGRFTCPDPARDHGRDGDFYDYCSDDPVNYVDVTGLFAFPLIPLALAGAAGSLGIAGGVGYGVAKGVDKLQSKRSGKESSAARDAVIKVAPMTAGTVTGGTLAVPALAAGVKAAPAVSTLLGKAGAAASAGAGQAYVRGSNAVARGAKAVTDLYQRNGSQILERAGQVKEFVSGYGLPPSQPTTDGAFWGLSYGLNEVEVNGVAKGGYRTLQNAWNEFLHPRDSATGKFTNK